MNLRAVLQITIQETVGQKKEDRTACSSKTRGEISALKKSNTALENENPANERADFVRRMLQSTRDLNGQPASVAGIELKGRLIAERTREYECPVVDS